MRDRDIIESPDTPAVIAEERATAARVMARGARRMSNTEYAALPTMAVGDSGRRGWSWLCDCGRSHLADDPLAAGDVLSCPRTKRQYRCL